MHMRQEYTQYEAYSRVILRHCFILRMQNCGDLCGSFAHLIPPALSVAEESQCFHDMFSIREMTRWILTYVWSA